MKSGTLMNRLYKKFFEIETKFLLYKKNLKRYFWKKISPFLAKKLNYFIFEKNIMFFNFLVNKDIFEEMLKNKKISRKFLVELGERNNLYPDQILLMKKVYQLDLLDDCWTKSPWSKDEIDKFIILGEKENKDEIL